MILVYTFRTFPWIEELKTVFPEVFVFGKLNEDLEKFKQEIEIKKPKVILGLAQGRYTRIETKAVNKFQVTKKIIKGGPEEYLLYTPEELKELFPFSKKTTDSFCNWTMYKIQDYLVKNRLNTRLIFIHINSTWGVAQVGHLGKIRQ